MLLTLKHNLHLLIAFQSLLFLLILVLPPYNKHRHNLFLAMFFLFQLLSEIPGLLKDVGRYDPASLTFTGVSPLVYFPGLPMNYMVIPSLYLYARALTDGNFRLRIVHILHGTVFFAVAGFVFSEFRSKGVLALIMISRYNDSLYIRQDYYNFRLLHLAQVFAYLALCLMRLCQRKTEYTGTASHIESNIGWLRIFISCLLLWGLLDGTSLVLYYRSFAHYPLGYIISHAFYLAAMTLLFVRAVSQRDILIPAEKTNDRKYEKNRLGEQQRERYLEILINYMDEYKPYLNPEASIKELSMATGISSHTISQVLNTCLKKNFYDFINSYRITQSIKLLNEARNCPMTITEILYESGFNSKSTFNTAFRKHTGMTPSEYKEKKDHSPLRNLSSG